MATKKSIEEQKPIQEHKPIQAKYIATVGRRRNAVARVRLFVQGSGVMTVNNKPIDQYFASQAHKATYMLPFFTTATANIFDITVKVTGGGVSGQLVAVVHGISRAIEKLDTDKYRALLKKKGLLTRDPRTRERRMVGMGGKARRKKQSPKR